MGLWSKLFGAKKKQQPYVPWSNVYFQQRVAHQFALQRAPAKGAFKGYEVLEEHAGGMGEVLIGRSGTGELYALKRIKQDLAGPKDDAGRRLADEATILFGLSYTYHLIPYDILSDAKRATCTIVLPYCCGGSLADRARSSRMPWEEVVHYGAVIAGELKDLHDAGLLHLDIKPANILLDRATNENHIYSWRPVLSDYGLSELRRGQAAVVARGGTPAFMAPEQFAQGRADARADIWGLGATLYALITGFPPLEAARREVAQGRPGQIPPANRVNPSCPAWVGQVLAGCLEADAAKRTPTAAALVEGLLGHIRVITDFKNDDRTDRAAAGQAETVAKLVVADRLLLAHSRRLGLELDGGANMIIDLGWVGRMGEAQKLYKAGSTASTRRAVAEIDKILGDWSDAGSLLGQFVAAPRAAVFNPKEIARRTVGGEERVSVQPPVPLSIIHLLLDLKCMSLVALIEEQALETDVEALSSTCRRWLATESFGGTAEGSYPAMSSLARIAQGLRFAGDPTQALKLLAETIGSGAGDMVSIFTAMYAARDIRDYRLAANLAERAAKKAMEDSDQETVHLLFAIRADLHFRARELDDAVGLYDKMLETIESPDLQMLAEQARARLRGSASRAAFELARKTIDRAEGLEQWTAAAEVALAAGEFEFASKVLNALLRDPRIQLATNRYDRELVQKLLGVVESGKAAPPAPPRRPAPLPPDLVAKVAAMSDEEFFYEAYVDRETGVLKTGGWKEIPRKAYVVPIDLKDLERIPRSSRRPVVLAFARFASHFGGSLFDFAHVQEDEYVAEFVAQHQSAPALVTFVAKLSSCGSCVPAPAELEAALNASRDKPKQKRVTFDIGLAAATGEGQLEAIAKRLDSLCSGAPLAPPQRYAPR